MWGCFSWMIVWLIVLTNQIETTMNNQSNIVAYNHTFFYCYALKKTVLTKLQLQTIHQLRY